MLNLSTSVDALIAGWHDEENISLVIYRHPFSRLASAYWNKFVARAQSWKYAQVSNCYLLNSSTKLVFQKIKNIISTYREEDEEGSLEYASPEEFLKSVLHELKTKPPHKVDPHWRPLHASCPFCLLNFTVYSNLEDNYEDSVYFFQRSGHLEKVEIGYERNVHSRSNDSKPKR